MEIAKAEIVALEKVAGVATNEAVELNELELALIGGGTGDIHFG